MRKKNICFRVKFVLLFMIKNAMHSVFTFTWHSLIIKISMCSYKW